MKTEAIQISANPLLLRQMMRPVEGCHAELQTTLTSRRLRGHVALATEEGVYFYMEDNKEDAFVPWENVMGIFFL